MPTIIDSLIVTLGLESGGFKTGKDKVEKGLKETAVEAEKVGDKLKKVGKEGAEGFEKTAKSVVKFLSVVGGAAAIKHFVEQMIESNAELDRLSKNLGDNANNISAWSLSAELAGGTAAGLQSTFSMLSKAQTELQLTGQSSLLPYFAALGVSLTDVNGKARPAGDLLLDLSDRFGHMDRPTANNMGLMMGVDQGTMNLLLKGRDEVQLTINKQKEFNAVTKQQAEEASRLKRSLTEGRQSFAAFGRELLSTATPAIEKVFSLLADLGAWMSANRETVNAFLTIIAVGLGAVAAASMPINLTVAAVVSLAAALAALYQDYQTWNKGGDSLIDWTAWRDGMRSVGDVAVWLKGIIADSFFRMAAAIDAAKSALNGDWDKAKWAMGQVLSGDTQPKSPDARGPMTPQKFFESKGWTPEQSAGIVANLQSESRIRPDAVGDNGKAYGIAQWHPDRQANFKKWSGRDIKGSSVEQQLAFVDYELTRGTEQKAGEALKSARTAQRAGEVVSALYERPADAEGESGKRGMLAHSLLFGIPGASQTAAMAEAGNVAQSAGNQNAPGNRSVETNISQINVYTAATDAKGITKDLGGEIDYLFTSQANLGLF